MTDYDPSWDITTIPADVFTGEQMRRLAARGRPGRRIPPRECPWCHQSFAPIRAWEKHKGICPKNPRVIRILAAAARQEPKP